VWGAELHHSAHKRRLGRFFNSSALGKPAVPRPLGTVPGGLAGMAELRPLSPGGAGGEKPLLFTTHKPSQMCKKKALVVHVTRW
jgi:hypothetical protein